MKTILLSLILFSTAIRPGWFGLGLTHHIQGREQWLVVRVVAPNGPGAKAGLQQGDVITTLGGKPIRFQDDVAVLEELAKIHAGQKVKFGVVRRGQKLVVVVTPAAMTDEQFERWKAMLEDVRRRATR